MKWHHRDTNVTKENNIETTKAASTPKPPTRAEQLFDLFRQWEGGFKREGLQGAWIDTEHEQAISIIYDEKSVLWISRIWEDNYWYMFGGKVWSKPRTLVFNEAFDCQLDMYIAALERVVEWKQRQEKERREFEISRF